MSTAGAHGNTAVPGIASVLMTPELIHNPPPNTGVRISRPGQVPAYTLDDAKAYFLSHPLIAGNPVPGTTVTLTVLAFYTHDQVDQLTHYATLDGVGPHDIVCYMEFSGTFRTDQLSAPQGHGFTRPVHKMHLVLNAITGRAVLFGFAGDA